MITYAPEPLLNKLLAYAGQVAMENSTENTMNSASSSAVPVARLARLVARQALTASLGTVDKTSEFPFVSLVSVAVSALGDPILLLSNLARHSQNLNANPRASLLFEAPLGRGDPLQAARVTVQGTIARTSEVQDCQRYLVRHSEAAAYSGFADFAFYRLTVVSAHFIGGFGRIQTFPRSEFCLPDTAHDGDKAVDSGLTSWTETHQDVLRQAWAQQIGSMPLHDQVVILAADCDGLDVRCGEAIKRLNFPQAITMLSDFYTAMETLAKQVDSN